MLPPIDDRLVAAMAAEFPDRAPDQGTDYPSVMFKAGQVSVVRWLVSKRDNQQEDLLATMELGGHN